MKYANLFGFFIWYYTLRMHNFANSALDYENWYCFISIKFDFKKKLIICRNFIASQGVSQALFDDVYVIFPIHVNFSITSRCVLKATVHRKKQWIVLRYLRKFSSKRCFYDMILYIDVAFEFFHFITICPYFSCFFIYHLFRHITFYTRDSFSIFIRGFPFSSFPSMFEISARTYCYF